ncbi:MAG TPA: class I SAM-dependent methyltransferase [Solirubrobacteraceae bacterium]|jgi:SAM-dependent methyltransferase|nr:class I SAM-dependent methyltransferase [Solirubrobacteraceae bacterium]
MRASPPASPRAPFAVHYAPRVQAEELRARIAAFPRWNYRFEFDDGVSTPVGDRARVNRNRERRAYFFERLLTVTGGSLRGRRVLDLGCGAGFWALAAIEAGAEFVLGLDSKREYIEQAELVFEAKQVDDARYRFQCDDFFATKLDGGFDTVLCLGVLDRIDRPVELFELMSGTGAELIVIDSDVSRARSSLFEVSHLYRTRDVSGDGMVLIPSRQAVAELAARHDFETVALALDVADYSGMDDYRRERRCAFICSRGRELGGVPAEVRGRVLPWWVRDPRALIDV